MTKVRLAAQPIIWSNDDFRDLGGDTPLETCLSEIKRAGYEGTELGHKFPREPRKLCEVLRAHGLALASGWHSAYLLSRTLEEEEKTFQDHMDLLSYVGTRVAIVAECTGAVYPKPGARLRGPSDPCPLSDQEWDKLASGLERLAELGEKKGLAVAYHHHMGTVIQTEAEVDRLMASTRKLKLLLDTGHLAFAGANPCNVLGRHGSRVVHVHLKNVRPPIVERARKEGWSFEKAVREGVFTVPGDGGLDFAPLWGRLHASDYHGWLVVEAEQDPRKANPLEYVKKARSYLRQMAGI